VTIGLEGRQKFNPIRESSNFAQAIARGTFRETWNWRKHAGSRIFDPPHYSLPRKWPVLGDVQSGSATEQEQQ